MIKRIVTTFVFAHIFLCQSAFSSQVLYEKEYNASWCNKNSGEQEYRTKDGSRVDCLLKEYAVECDRAKKWKEAVGQSLFYAIQTNKKPGILLIVEDEQKEGKYIDRLNIVAQKYQITVWKISPEDLKK